MPLKPLSKGDKLTITDAIETAVDRAGEADIQKEQAIATADYLADDSNEVFCIRGFSRDDLVNFFGILTQEQADNLSDEKLQELAHEIGSKMSDDFVEVFNEVFNGLDEEDIEETED
ncbi:MAG: hypothetical protein ABEI54_05270 [Candidatus Bipolaricaulia bacterium]